MMISPYDTSNFIKNSGARFGENVTLSNDIDISECEQFFGTRCPHNVHVKGKRKAHLDRKDPRYDPLGHLKHDVGIPYSLMGAAGGLTLGGTMYKKDRKKGALCGAAILGGIGLIADIVSAYRKQKTPQYYL